MLMQFEVISLLLQCLTIVFDPMLKNTLKM